MVEVFTDVASALPSAHKPPARGLPEEDDLHERDHLLDDVDGAALCSGREVDILVEGSFAGVTDATMAVDCNFGVSGEKAPFGRCAGLCGALAPGRGVAADAAWVSSLADRVKRCLAGGRHGARRGSDLQRIRRSLDPTAAASLGDQPGPGTEGVGPAASRRHPCRVQTTRCHPQTARRPRQLVLLAIASAGGTIVQPVLFVLDVLALVMFVTHFRAGGHGARTY